MTVVIEDFEILDELGRGAMGTVYRARQVSLGREVAIKVMRADLGVDELAVRFEHEARAAMTHPAIVPIYSFGRTDGMPYLVMAYMRGGTLQDRLRRDDHLSQRDTAMVGASLAGALAMAHDRGIVHRDVKPSNVLLDESGNAYLGDFGVARVPELTRVTSTSAIIGTVDYLAPEIIQGEVATPASDLYALGGLLFECLTGAPPFTGENAMAVMFRHRFDNVPPLPDTLDPDLRTLISGCLAKDPAVRPTATEVADELRHLGAALSSQTTNTALRGSTEAGRDAVAATREPVVTTVERRRVHRRLRFALGLAAAVAVVGTGAVLLASDGERDATKPQGKATSGEPPVITSVTSAPGPTVPAQDVEIRTTSTGTLDAVQLQVRGTLDDPAFGPATLKSDYTILEDPPPCDSGPATPVTATTNVTYADGDIMRQQSSGTACQFGVNGDGYDVSTSTGTFTVAGGTGKFRDATGGGELACVVDGQSETTGTITCTANGTIHLAGSDSAGTA